jgi:hypothetical protein
MSLKFLPTFKSEIVSQLGSSNYENKQKKSSFFPSLNQYFLQIP